MDEIIILGIASDAKKIGEQNSAAIEAIKGGMRYKGEVANYASLPATGNKSGDIWKTTDTGKKYIWGKVGGVDQWSLWDEPTEALTNAEIDYIVADKYSIIVTLTNATADASNPADILPNGTATLNFTFDGTSYVCPNSVSVTGATGVWTKVSNTQGTMALSNPTGDVSFTVAGKVPWDGTTLAGTTWQMKSAVSPSGLVAGRTYDVYASMGGEEHFADINSLSLSEYIDGLILFLGSTTAAKCVTYYAQYGWYWRETSTSSDRYIYQEPPVISISSAGAWESSVASWFAANATLLDW